jgi:hypothetical protein
MSLKGQLEYLLPRELPALPVVAQHCLSMSPRASFIRHQILGKLFGYLSLSPLLFVGIESYINQESWL